MNHPVTLLRIDESTGLSPDVIVAYHTVGDQLSVCYEDQWYNVKEAYHAAALAVLVDTGEFVESNRGLVTEGSSTSPTGLRRILSCEYVRVTRVGKYTHFGHLDPTRPGRLKMLDGSTLYVNPTYAVNVAPQFVTEAQPA